MGTPSDPRNEPEGLIEVLGSERESRYRSAHLGKFRLLTVPFQENCPVGLLVATRKTKL